MLNMGPLRKIRDLESVVLNLRLWATKLARKHCKIPTTGASWNVKLLSSGHNLEVCVFVFVKGQL